MSTLISLIIGFFLNLISIEDHKRKDDALLRFRFSSLWLLDFKKLLLIVDVVDVMKIVEAHETGKYRCAQTSPLEKVL